MQLWRVLNGALLILACTLSLASAGSSLVGDSIAAVASEAALFDALDNPGVGTIVLTNSIFLTAGTWTRAPAQVGRSILITSNAPQQGQPDTTWPVLALQYVSNRIQLAPNVTVTFNRVFIKGMRSENIIAYPGMNALLPVAAPPFSQYVLDNAALIILACFPREVVLSPQTLKEFDRLRPPNYIMPGNVSVRLRGAAQPALCADDAYVQQAPANAPRCFPPNNVFQFENIAAYAVRQDPVSNLFGLAGGYMYIVLDAGQRQP